MNRKLLTPYALKFNPFSSQIPVEALWSSPVIGQFCWRVEQQLGEGGFARFALITGVSGSGKSATLRLLQSRLASQRELTLGVLSRPQAALADVYRELGDLFGVPLRPHNRWASAKALRERWLQHLDTALVRPVLLVDEAQEMHAAVLAELRLLTSAELDSRSILTVVLAGDDRLCARLETPELVPWPVASARDCAPRRRRRPTCSHVPAASPRSRRQRPADDRRAPADPLRTRRRQSAPLDEHGQRTVRHRV